MEETSIFFNSKDIKNIYIKKNKILKEKTNCCFFITENRRKKEKIVLFLFTSLYRIF